MFHFNVAVPISARLLTSHAKCAKLRFHAVIGHSSNVMSSEVKAASSSVTLSLHLPTKPPIMCKTLISCCNMASTASPCQQKGNYCLHDCFNPHICQQSHPNCRRLRYNVVILHQLQDGVFRGESSVYPSLILFPISQQAIHNVLDIDSTLLSSLSSKIVSSEVKTMFHQHSALLSFTSSRHVPYDLHSMSSLMLLP